MKKCGILLIVFLFFIYSNAFAVQQELNDENHVLVSQAYDNIAKGDYKSAKKTLFKVLMSQPDNEQVNLLMAQVSEKQNKLNDAKIYYSRTISANPNNSFAYASRGYVNQKLMQNKDAISDFNKALELKNLPKESIDNVIASIEMLSKKNTPPVVEVIIPVEPSPIAEVVTPVEPQKTPPAAPKIPYIDKQLKKARTAIENENYLRALDILDSIKISAQPKKLQGEIMYLQATSLWKNNDFDAAYEKYEAATKLLQEKFYLSESYWLMAEYKENNGNNLEALSLARQSVKMLPNNEVRNLQMAYMALRNGRDKEATYYFEQAMKSTNANTKNDDVLLDTAYAYKRIGENEKLLEYLERTIDIEIAKVDATHSPKDIARLYYARREHADLIRKYGSNTNLQYVRTQGNNYAWQALQEFFWQPYYENGKLVQVYAQMLDTITSKYGKQGASRAYSVIGARVEPLAQYNLVLSFEQLLKVGSKSQDDTRFKIGYSWDDGLEQNPILDNWNYTTFFNEFIHSTKTGQDIYVMEARQGRSFKLKENWILSPHAFIAGDYNSDAYEGYSKWNGYIGPGLHFRYWYREDKYNAPQSYFDTFLQFRAGITNNDNMIILNFYNSL